MNELSWATLSFAQLGWCMQIYFLIIAKERCDSAKLGDSVISSAGLVSANIAACVPSQANNAR